VLFSPLPERPHHGNIGNIALPCRIYVHDLGPEFTLRMSSMSKILYGIPNCDTVKKARTWLAEHNIEFSFHDFKKQGLDRETAARWLEQLDWETLVNRKGTTWRNLPDERKAAVVDKTSALELILENTSVIKRPVLEGAGQLSVGFSADAYTRLFAEAA
jgi:arsenate reductase